MGKNNYFEFKQFKVIHEKSAMKVGIDGVLLGAWSNFDNCQRILDIGTGTGLLSLMAAQRSKAIIDAVEIDSDAAMEAELNFSNSGWSERLNVSKMSFQDFETDKRYDHIISNPPFFENSLKPNDEKRLKARHTDSLSLDELLAKAKQYLRDDGSISLILPADKDDQLAKMVEMKGLFVKRKCFVHPFISKKPNRILIELLTMPCESSTNKIIIRNEETHLYSEEYKSLTTDFYLSH